MKRIHFIVTSGGTREPIDDVRYIGNSSTGRLGASIAQAAASRGHRVSLIHGTGSFLPSSLAGMETTRFVTAADLREVLEQSVKSGGDPCAVVMCAAVADYTPDRSQGKISSQQDELVIRLKKVGKIVDLIKTWKPGLLLVKFKLQSGCTRDELIRIGQDSLKQSGADLIVVNDIKRIDEGKHPAVLLWPDGRTQDLDGKGAIAKALVAAVEDLVPGTSECR